MSLDVTGIKNENEFYYEHYFSSMLGEGLKPVFDSWAEEKEDGAKAPNKQLEAYRKDFLRVKARLEKARRIDQVVDEWRPNLIQLLQILGYEFKPSVLTTTNNLQIPLVARVDRSDESAELIAIEALSTESEYYDGLKCEIHGEQYPKDFEDINIPEKSIEDLLSLALFDGQQPPRWALVFSKSEVILIDRSKWSEKRLMRFDLDEILGRKESSTIKATAALLHRDQLVPSDGICLLDTLDENSHKHAHGVSEDLKYSLREAIELIGQEAVDYYREKRKEKVYDQGDKMAEQLSLECLRYMYRLLFLFYIESRPELGYAPMNSETYNKGYSLEALRDLELARLTTPESQEGTTIHEWIERLFSLVYEGEGWQEDTLGMVEEGSRYHTFTMPPLKTHLFDPKRTPILSKVKFRNKVLRQVIELMSLSREKDRKKSKRGRVSYAELGINQLGAVYEALLSFRGFFAEEDLYEVKKAGTDPDPLEPAYFVTKDDLEKYDQDEKVFKSDGTFKIYEKGTFIYRLSGRDREKSASYYTPEVLTQCLVKYALKELLKDKTADDILKLTVCEPAMGSAAFLNEAVNQLAEAYLALKQKETGENIPHDKYVAEKQKVKMYLADNNVYGVDLNPVAVELAEVSLWLNTIHEGGFVPWFGMQLVSGNSLIGARKQVFDSDMLKANPDRGRVWRSEVPVRVEPGKERPEDGIYHFLVPDEGMAKYTDKVVKKLVPDEIKKIEEWRKEFVKPYDEEEIAQLKRFSEEIDRLWSWHTQNLHEIRGRTTDHIEFFGRTDDNSAGYSPQPTSTAQKDKIFDEVLHSRGMKNSSPYKRLKLVMDYWCSLWFWPIQKADQLPSRSEYFMELSMVLLGNVFEAKTDENGQASLFSETLSKEETDQLRDAFGLIDLEKLAEKFPRLKTVTNISAEQRFLHWELEFADVFQERGGFDLILGNPPWSVVSFSEDVFLSDINPRFKIHGKTAKFQQELNTLKDKLLGEEGNRIQLFSEYASTRLISNYLNNLSNYPKPKGVNSNLYKCFFILSWDLVNFDGHIAFLHDKNIYDDAKGSGLRVRIYERAAFLFRIFNLTNYFPEEALDHAGEFCITVMSGKKCDQVKFRAIFNVVKVESIDACLVEQNKSLPLFLKDKNGNWEVRGSKERVISIGESELEIFSNLMEEKGGFDRGTKIPLLHNIGLLEVIEKVSNFPDKIGGIGDRFVGTTMCTEKSGKEKEWIEEIESVVPEGENEILMGPHYYHMNSYAKMPNENCRSKMDYSAINPVKLPWSIQRRTVYKEKTPGSLRNQFSDIEGHINQHRIIFRRMAKRRNERTLIPAIIHPGILHLDGSLSVSFNSDWEMVLIAGLCGSLPYDFIMKASGRENIFRSTLASLPFLRKFENEIVVRTLRLNCLSSNFDSLWKSCWRDSFKNDNWARSKKINSEDEKYCGKKYSKLSDKFEFSSSVRGLFQRRELCLELDVLVAIGFGISLPELVSMYKLHFATLEQNERDTWFDTNGNIVFTKSRNFPSIGISTKEWSGLCNEGSATDYVAESTKEYDVSEFTPPYQRFDRSNDYEEIWPIMEKRLTGKGQS